MREINLNRQLLGLEDLEFGTGTVEQTRAGTIVTITKINAGNLPFDETRTLVEFAQEVNLEELGNSVEAINNLNNNLDKLLIVEDNLPIINNVEAIKESIVTLDTNILALQNIDTNMSSINTVEDNLTEVVSVAQNIVPNLTEILNVDTLAVQVTQDKSDISSMKLAVETIYDTFDDRFLGTKTVDPTLDNDGNSLIDGTMYFNTTSNAMKVYDVGTTTWYSIPQIYLSALLDVELTSITTGDILVWDGTKWSNTANPKVDSIQFNGGTGTEGTVSWNSDEGTLDLVANTTTLQIGQETYINAKNQTGNTITDGIVVMAVGTLGASGRILIAPYDGISDPKYILGITTESIVNGSNGKITTFGKIRGLDTSMFAEGAKLFVTTSGGLTNVEPSTGVNIAIAYVINSHASNGTIMVRFTPYDENLSYSKTEIDSSYGNVDNTSDLDKPVSTDTQIALDLKAPLDSATLVNPTINGIAQSGYSGFKNLIINGNFDIWQRGNTQTGSGYGSDDRWANANSGSLKTHSMVDTTDTERALFNASKFSRTVVTSVAGDTNFVLKQQGIENVIKLAGKTVTVSFWAKADSNKSIELGLVQDFSIGGSTSSPVINIGQQLISLTSTWQKKTITITIPSIIGKTLETNGEHTTATWLRFTFDSGTSFEESIVGQQSGTFDIAQVQLEEGSVATPFEQRPYGLELSLCQRYYRKNQTLEGFFKNSTEFLCANPYYTEMRVPPTVFIISGVNAIHDPIGVSFKSFTGMNAAGEYINITGTTASRINNGGQLISGHLSFNAEL